MTVRVGWAGPAAPLSTCRPTFSGCPPVMVFAQSLPVQVTRPVATLHVMPQELTTDLAPESGQETDHVAWLEDELTTSCATYP